MKDCLGKHYIIEYEGCNEQFLRFTESVEQALLGAVERAGATYVAHEVHQFSPFGVSGVVVIAESHFTIHTWPERRYAAVDIFTCGTMDARAAIDYLRNVFSAKNCEVHVLERGVSLTDTENGCKLN